MLRSKFHRPWQPHVSGGQLYNPSAHSTETEVSFSDAIGEVEEGMQTPTESPGAVRPDARQLADGVESAPAVAETSGGQSKWYLRLVERLTH